MEEIIVIAVCLLFNAILASYEMAFVTVSRGALKKLAKEGNHDAQKLLKLRTNPERTLSIIQIGITLVGAISSAVGGAGASESIEPYFRLQMGMSENSAEFLSIILVVLPITFLSVVVGELTPKSIALKNPLKITLLGAKALFIADRFLSPLVTVLEWSTKQLLRLIRSKPPVATAETIIEIDALPSHHQQAILNLAHIERRKIKDALVPWVEVNSVKASDEMEAVTTVIFSSGHTRLPVLDEKGTPMGILHTKECLALREVGNRDWHHAVHPLLLAQASDPVLSVFRVMQKKKSHMAVVMNADQPAGIVTLEDISEEIWGELYDEDDDSRVRKIFADRVKNRIFPLK